MSQIILIPSDQIYNLDNKGVSEKTRMVKLCNDVKSHLKKVRNVDITVYKDKLPENLQDEINFTNFYPEAIVINMHSNAFEKNTASGVEGFYYSSDLYMKKVAKKLVNAISMVTGLKVRRVESFDDLIMLGGIIPSSCLIETYFHDNDYDIRKYEENYSKVVNEIAYVLYLISGNLL